MSTKIEMVLHKKISGQKWSVLEASSTSESLTSHASISGTTPPVPTMAAASTPTSGQGSGPVYPTSSRHGTKNWDKLAVELTSKKQSKAADSKGKSKEADQEDEGEKSDGADSVDSDYGTSDPVDAFFKKLYANADPDTRRAMVKSYYESQGTALSTNWDEVGKGKVETRPPSD
jgi:SGS domain